MECSCSCLRLPGPPPQRPKPPATAASKMNVIHSTRQLEKAPHRAKLEDRPQFYIPTSRPILELAMGHLVGLLFYSNWRRRRESRRRHKSRLRTPVRRFAIEVAEYRRYEQTTNEILYKHSMEENHSAKVNYYKGAIITLNCKRARYMLLKCHLVVVITDNNRCFKEKKW